jgi:hypothetical protein
MKVLVIGHLTGRDIRPYPEAEGRRIDSWRPTIRWLPPAGGSWW